VIDISSSHASKWQPLTSLEGHECPSKIPPFHWLKFTFFDLKRLTTDPVFVIMEWVNGGKLQSFLRKSRAEHYYGNLHGSSSHLTSRDLTSFAYQVARAMDYLTVKGVSTPDAQQVITSTRETHKLR
jgi:serine/threonine protein kinase